MISVKFRGWRELQAKFGKFPTKFREEIGEAVLRSAEEMASRVRAEAPVKTGTLRDSISIRYRFPDEAWIFIAEPAHAYALFIEEGTRPHLIKPITGTALRFDIDGTVFSKYVRHPGIRPNPFMKRGYEEAGKKVERIFERATQRAVDLLSL